jgi:small subunit ribosomal protein S20
VLKRPICNEESDSKMANTKSATKAARQATRRMAINKSRASQVKSYVRKVEEAIASGDQEAAKAALAAAQPILMRSAQKRVVHKKAASRKVSRLTARLKAMA